MVAIHGHVENLHKASDTIMMQVLQVSFVALVAFFLVMLILGVKRATAHRLAAGIDPCTVLGLDGRSYRASLGGPSI